MGIFNKPKKGGFSDVIRCDEKDYLIWKWHPSKYNEGDLKRETAIRTNSILRVKNGEVAVFFYKHNDGHLQDYVEGPFEDKIKTKNFPILSSLIGIWYEGDTPFQAEIFFINTSKTLQIRFGIPYFNVIDPRFLDYEVPVAVRGTATFGITDYKKFIDNNQLRTISTDEVMNKAKDIICRYIKEVVTSAPKENNIPVISIETKIDEISKLCEEKIKDRIFQVLGITIFGIDLSAIEIDKESNSYIELKSVTKDITKRQVEANILNYEEQLRIQREEAQYEKRMQTRQQNLAAYQTEANVTVGVAGAEALGKMSENGAGNINMGAGYNPVNIMAGMTLGSAIGQNMAGTINNTQATSGPNVPPPLPKIKYFVAVDGAPTGPFDIDTLRSMVSNGNFMPNSLVWKEGMAEWKEANTQPDLAIIFPPKIK